MLQWCPGTLHNSGSRVHVLSISLNSTLNSNQLVGFLVFLIIIPYQSHSKTQALPPNSPWVAPCIRVWMSTPSSAHRKAPSWSGESRLFGWCLRKHMEGDIVVIEDTLILWMLTNELTGKNIFKGTHDFSNRYMNVSRVLRMDVCDLV